MCEPAAEQDRQPDDERATLEYRDSHSKVLWQIWRRSTDSGQPARELNAVVMPTCRDLTGEVPGLDLAAGIAQHYRCPLIVFMSKEARREDVPQRLSDRLGELLVLIDMRAVPSAWKPQLESAKHPLSRLRRDNDVGSKRNLGLTLGVASGWDSILFVDDDIKPMPAGHTLNPFAIDHALRLMHAQRELKAVGWAAEWFPDNSVIGHARRDLGLTQDVFVGGGAQLIACDHVVPFSPDVYNEDWLQTLSLLKRRSAERCAVGFAGHVLQVEYDPYTPKRAASEEAGDLIAEALMNVFETGGLTSPAALTESFWRTGIRVRGELIRGLLLRLQQGCEPDPGRRRKMIAAMEAALEVNRSLRPAAVRQYLQALDDDERRWADHLLVLSGKTSECDGVPSPEVPLKDLEEGMQPSWLSTRTLRRKGEKVLSGRKVQKRAEKFKVEIDKTEILV